MIEFIKAFVIGVIQGITEWLPVSSTGHMILFDEFFPLDVGADFMKMFEVVIQLGSILAVVVLYFGRLNPFSPKKNASEKKSTWRLWLMVVIAVAPSAVVGILLDDIIGEYLEGYVVVSGALIVYGIAFILTEKLKTSSPSITELSEITYRQALGIGCFQVLSLIPGTSRSGSTILGGILLGFSRPAAAEFSFFMAVPTMLGASVIRGGKYALKLVSGETVMSGNELIILVISFVTAFAISVVAIKFLMDFVKKHTFTAFGVYRIALGAAVLIYFSVVALAGA